MHKVSTRKRAGPNNLWYHNISAAVTDIIPIIIIIIKKNSHHVSSRKQNLLKTLLSGSSYRTQTMKLKWTTKSFPIAVICNIVLQYFVRVLERHTGEIWTGWEVDLVFKGSVHPNTQISASIQTHEMNLGWFVEPEYKVQVNIWKICKILEHFSKNHLQNFTEENGNVRLIIWDNEWAEDQTSGQGTNNRNQSLDSGRNQNGLTL